MIDSVLASILRENSLIHIGGESGAGKTLLAAEFAALVSRNESVDWICADAKKSFIHYLKRAIKALDGRQSNLTITLVDDHRDALDSIVSVHDRLRDDTGLVVVDPITRVLDMSRRNGIMWGRALFEDALPSLVGLTLQRKIVLLVTSEVRYRSGEIVPIFWESLKKWIDVDLLVKRLPDSRISELYQVSEKETANLLTRFRVTDDGLVLKAIERNQRRRRECSEAQFIG